MAPLEFTATPPEAHGLEYTTDTPRFLTLDRVMYFNGAYHAI